MTMYTLYFVLFLVSLGVAITTTPLLRQLALKYHIMIDFPNERRRIHAKATPRNGGIGIAFATLCAIGVGVVLLPISDGQQFQLAGVLSGGLLIIFLGVVDDTKGMKAGAKFLGQGLAAALLVLFDIRIDTLTIFSMDPIQLPFPISASLTVFWVLATINALNLIDGMDGLAGGVALIAAISLFALAMMHNKALMAMMTIALVGSTAGFLRYNYPPASIFMGDCGAMFLGFMLAAVSIQCSQGGSDPPQLLIPITILGIPLMDTTFAIVRRLGRRQHPFKADKEHLHHKLLGLGLNTRHAVLIIHSYCALLGAVALVATAMPLIFLTISGPILIAMPLLVSISNVKQPKQFVLTSQDELTALEKEVLMKEQKEKSHCALSDD